MKTMNESPVEMSDVRLLGWSVEPYRSNGRGDTAGGCVTRMCVFPMWTDVDDQSVRTTTTTTTTQPGELETDRVGDVIDDVTRSRDGGGVRESSTSSQFAVDPRSQGVQCRYAVPARSRYHRVYHRRRR